MKHILKNINEITTITNKHDVHNCTFHQFCSMFFILPNLGFKKLVL